MQAVLIVGGPAPYREALSGRLSSRGHTVVTESPVEQSRRALHEVGPLGSAIAVFNCATEADWHRLADSGYLGRVAVLVQLDPLLYRRAIERQGLFRDDI